MIIIFGNFLFLTGSKKNETTQSERTGFLEVVHYHYSILVSYYSSSPHPDYRY